MIASRSSASPKRILITGGSGYLGGWVARLAQTGWAVTATYLTTTPGASSATWRQVDIRDADAVRALVAAARPAVIVHTAAIHGGTEEELAAVNVAGSAHVARAAAVTGARLIHISTDALFNGNRGNYHEGDRPSPITPYGRSKARAEEAVRQSGAEAVIVRTSLIYGWRPHIDRQVRWMWEALKAGRDLRLFADEIRCPIWVESLAAAVIELAGTDYTGLLHVAGAQPLSRYDFGVRLLRFHGLDASQAIAASSQRDGLNRPLDCSLDCTRAQRLLDTPLPGVDDVLSRQTAGG